MATIYDLKPKFQQLLRPMVRGLASAGITPNQVTLAALFLSVGIGICIMVFPTDPRVLLLVPLTLFIRMALNAIDGMLAREYDMKTELGTILNELGDVFSDAVLYLPLCVVPGIHPLWVMVVVMLSIVSEMAGVVAIQIGANRRYDGPMGKSDRAFVFGVAYLVLGVSVVPVSWINYLMMITATLVGITIVNRCYQALKTKT